MNAGHVQEDAQAARELANLLGRELVAAKKRITLLEHQLQKSKTLVTQFQAKPSNPVSEPTMELQQEIEGYKQEQTRLQDRLKRLKERLQDAKKQKKDLRKQLEIIETQRDRGWDEASEVRPSYRDLKQRSGKSNTTAADVSGGNDELGPDPFHVMSALPICPTRPNHGSLLPVIQKRLRPSELYTYLSSDRNIQRYSDRFMFFPGQFAWCNSTQGFHHALAFGPTHVFNIQTRCWEKKSLLESMYGLVKELFFVEQGKIFYGGTYKCVRLRNSVIRWPEPEAEGLTHLVMAEAALSENFSNAPSSRTHKGTIGKLYRDGVLELECMGLECVGFNRYLYNQFLRHPAPKKKRNTKDSAGDRAEKKRRLK